MTFFIMAIATTLSIETLSIKTLRMVTFSIMFFSITTLQNNYKPVGIICDIQQNTVYLCRVSLRRVS